MFHYNTRGLYSNCPLLHENKKVNISKSRLKSICHISLFHFSVTKWSLETQTYSQAKTFKVDCSPLFECLQTGLIVNTRQINISYVVMSEVCCDGYILRSNKCEPTCNPECINGTCSSWNTCTCQPGFKHDPGNKFRCQPICDPECINGQCSGPNQCDCYEGYQKSNKSDHICNLLRPESGVNGEYVGQKQWICFPGYKTSNKSALKCEPVCKPACINGKCIAPNFCQCWEGYYPIPDETSNYTCTSICLLDCGNGTCDTLKKCDCFEGYYFDATNMTCVVRDEESLKTFSFSQKGMDK